VAASFFGTLAHGDEPRTFLPDENARELRTIAESETAVSAQWNAREKSRNSAFETTSGGNPLRWRVKQAGATITPVEHPTQKVTAGAATSNVVRTSFAERARQSSRVKNVAALEDPFGDRKYAVQQAQAEEADLNPPGEVEAQPMVEPQPLEEETPRPLRRFVPPVRPAAPPAAAPQDEIPEPEPEAPMAEPRAFGKYNDRNCSVDGKSCEDHRTRIKSDILVEKDDLIDITAPLILKADTKEQQERSLQNFNRIPSRQWRNRAGDVMAVGRLREVAYRYAIINDESGSTAKIKLNELGDDEQCFLAGWWNVPSECILGDEIHPGRNWVPSNMTWTASALCHKPLYFEEVQLERYGHTIGFFQPVLSGAHFFVNIATLPYHAGINPPNECQYALGYYRPGSCAPWMIPPIPLSVRGAAVQAAAVGGIWPLIP
jgi:hypothetical protein